MQYFQYLFNKTEENLKTEGNNRLSLFAKIMNSKLHGDSSVGLCSCINRSDIGRYFGMGFFSYIADSIVGNYCTIASRVSIGAFSHPTDLLTVHEIGHRDTSAWYGNTIYQSDPGFYFELRDKKTTIGSDVWIGDNAVVRKGVTIGNGAIVGAGSVVTKDIEPFAIVAGNPAKIIRKRFSPDLIIQIQESKWWDLSMEELQGIPFFDIPTALQKLKEKEATRGGALP